MVIDQRNNGASVTPASGAYTVDRWVYFASQASKFTAQQSSIAPLGFTKSLLLTTASAVAVGASDTFQIQQPIEGFNTADLGWGTASAKTVTLSFWVRSSLTGTFGGALKDASTRSYPFTYTISAANTFEYKTITIAGDTSGTWPTDNSASIRVAFGLGSGSTFSGTANSWQAGNFSTATGAVSVVGTSGATFYITGVQLELGSAATTFDFRSIGQELALCQRYFERLGGVNGTDFLQGSFFAGTFGVGHVAWAYKVTKRATPTISLASGSVGTTTSITNDYVTVNANGGVYPTISSGSTASIEL
jgi:hypothetical protein